MHAWTAPLAALGKAGLLLMLVLRSAIRIDNVRGEKVGHLPRDVVSHVSPPAPGYLARKVDH